MQLLSESRETAGAQDVARVLVMLQPRLGRVLRQHLRAPGPALSMPQFVALRALNHGPKSAGKLAQVFGVSRPAITRLVDGLVKKGLVERRADEADRRVAIVALTAAGQALHESTEEATERFLAELLAELPPDRLTRLEGALADLSDLLDRAEGPSAHRRPIP